MLRGIVYSGGNDENQYLSIAQSAVNLVNIRWNVILIIVINHNYYHTYTKYKQNCAVVIIIIIVVTWGRWEKFILI